MSNFNSHEVLDLGYKPPTEVLKNYAKVMVNFALNNGEGIIPDEVVQLSAPLSALPFYRELNREIIDSGGHVISRLTDNMAPGAKKYFYDKANESQLTRFLDKYEKGVIDDSDHMIFVKSDYDPHELDDVDPKLIMQERKSKKQVYDWVGEKEAKGEFSWTIALYGTQAMAIEAELTQEEYWDEIIKACYLDYEDPVKEWQRISKEIGRVAAKLTNLDIDSLHITGEDADLRISIGENRRWIGGGGSNIPSYEIFASPDWRGTNGWIRFNQPLHYLGKVAEGVMLVFENGRVVRSSATKNEEMLKQLLATDEGAAQLGEVSLTDRRLSRITKYMASTLFDENIGGIHGNTHIAVGRSYLDTYNGDAESLEPEDIKNLGFNESSIHSDLISTTDRVVIATLKNGSEQKIYEKGQFTI
jgi:aminopeptidase